MAASLVFTTILPVCHVNFSASKDGLKIMDNKLQQKAAGFNCLQLFEIKIYPKILIIYKGLKSAILDR